MGWEDSRYLRFVDNPWYIYWGCVLILVLLFFDVLFIGSDVPLWFVVFSLFFCLLGFGWFGLLMRWKD
jgi:hypothetical protein